MKTKTEATHVAAAQSLLAELSAAFADDGNTVRPDAPAFDPQVLSPRALEAVCVYAEARGGAKKARR